MRITFLGLIVVIMVSLLVGIAIGKSQCKPPNEMPGQPGQF